MPSHNIHHLLDFFNNRELNELYSSIAMRSFAFSVIGIFIPIYLLVEGYSLTMTLLFFSVITITMVLVTLPVAKIASKFGFKHLILYSIPFSVLAFLGLYNLNLFQGIIFLDAVFFGVANMLFWMGFHVDFCKFSDKKNRGKQVGVARVSAFLFHAAGPVMGGLILAFFGFKILFLVVILLLFCSAIPLFYSKDIHSVVDFSFDGIFKGQKIKDAFSFFGFGIERATGYVIWPIFIFFFILGESFTLLGGVASLALFFSSFFILIVGKYSDIYRKMLLKIGAISNAVVWFIKGIFIKTVFGVFVIDALYGMTQTTMNVPFDAIVYDKAGKSNAVKYIVFKEMMVNLGRTFFFLMMIILEELTIGIFGGGVLGSILQLLL